MAIDLVGYEVKAQEAVKAFWSSRDQARQKQVEAGGQDRGERASVTAGKNMDKFIELIIDLVRANGLHDAEIHQHKGVLTLPGYFRPTKLWDLLIMRDGKLIAAIELKSQVGPSFGNNFNNRSEEAIGTAHDFSTAYREGAFGACPTPFVGWLMLVEDAPESRSPVSGKSPHFPISAEFNGASYLKRYDILCQRLMREKLYTRACLMVSERSAVESGKFECITAESSLKAFITGLAGHIAAEAAASQCDVTGS